jgi:hypothetical protein
MELTPVTLGGAGGFLLCLGGAGGAFLLGFAWLSEAASGMSGDGDAVRSMEVAEAG